MPRLSPHTFCGHCQNQSRQKCPPSSKHQEWDLNIIVLDVEKTIQLRNDLVLYLKQLGHDLPPPQPGQDNSRQNRDLMTRQTRILSILSGRMILFCHPNVDCYCYDFTQIHLISPHKCPDRCQHRHRKQIAGVIQEIGQVGAKQHHPSRSVKDLL